MSRAREVASRIDDFVRDVVMPAEPAPGSALTPEDRGILQRQAQLAGVFAPHVPSAFGGLGLTIAEWPDVFEAAGYSPIGPAVLNCMAPDEGNMHLLHEVGTPDQLARYLTPLARGERRSCFAMTEPHPGAGSDPSALQTTATRTPNGWRIEGVKRFISGAIGASFAIVMARTKACDGHAEGATMFLVDLDNAGVRVGRHIHTPDRAIDGGHPHLIFDSCFVTDDAVLGEPGLGFRYAQVRLGPARLTHCMRWLGLARRSLDTALDRTARRELFGSRVDRLGIAQELISQSVIDIETTEAMIRTTAAALVEDPARGLKLSSIAKVYASESVYRVIDRSIQLCGGDGVSDDLPLLSYLLEVRPFRIYDGANEALKWSIAKGASRDRRQARESGVAPLDLVPGHELRP